MIRLTNKIGVFLIISLFIGISLIPLSPGSITQDTSSTTERADQATQTYSTGGILLPESEIPNVLPTGLGEPPKTWDWRNASINGIQGDWMTSVKHQGKCGSCWAFAAIGTLEAMLNIRLNDPDFDLDLSEQQLVSCCGYPCNGCRGGSTYHSWLYLLEHGGAILESCFPYEQIDARGCQLYGDCDLDPVECEDKKEGWNYQQIPIDSDVGAISEPDRETMQSLIATHGPIASYILVYSDFNKYTGGIYRHRNGNLVGGHIVSLVGYNDEQGYWIGKNSWGKYWGENGYFRIAYGECYIENQIYYVDVDMETLNFPPTANCGGIYQGDSDEPISFHADQSTDMENNIVSYHWEFGDGSTSTQMNPTHTYTEKGIYTVRLTVTDEQGKTDTDEGAVFVDLWETGDYWTYDVSFESDEESLYPPILLPGSGSIDNLTLTVIDEDDQSYYLDFTGDVQGNVALNVDLEKIFFNLRAWTSFKHGSISGSLTISKAGFGIEEISLRIKGLGQLLILPIVPLPIWLPLPIDIVMEKTYDEPKILMGGILDHNEQWQIPPAQASMQFTIQAVFGMFFKTFDSEEFTDDDFTYICTDETMVETPAGSYQAFQLSSLSTYRNLDLYYAPSIQNVVKFTGGGGASEIFFYTGNLISTNTAE